MLSDREALAARVITVAEGGARARRDGVPPATDDVADLVPYGLDARQALELTFREALRVRPQLHRD